MNHQPPDGEPVIPRQRRGAPRRPRQDAPNTATGPRQGTAADHERTTSLTPVLPLSVCGLTPGGQLHDGDLDELDAWHAAGHHLADYGLIGIAPAEVFAALRVHRRPA